MVPDCVQYATSQTKSQPREGIKSPMTRISPPEEIGGKKTKGKKKGGGEGLTMTRRVAGTPCLQISQDSSTRVQQGLVAEKNTTPMQNSERKKKKKRVQEKKKNKRHYNASTALKEMGVNFGCLVNFHLLLQLAVVYLIRVGWAVKRTILKLLSSSLICCARRGVNRLHVAISPRRSYSPLVQVS